MGFVKTTCAATLAGLVLVGCGTQTDAPPSDRQSSVSISSPTAASSPSATPAVSSTVAPTVRSSPSPVAETRLEIFTSAVDGLRLRTGPSTAAERVAYRTGTDGALIALDAGETLAALDGPVVSDGFDWYLVQLTSSGRGVGQLGWAATPHVGDAWLVPGELECPPAPLDLATAIAMAPAEALYCSGGDDLSFEGHVVTGFGCNVMGTFEPEWLAHPCANMSFISPVPPSETDRPLFLHYPAPGVPNPTLSYSDEPLVRIVGHYDDPAAAGCIIEPVELSPGAPAFGATDPAADDAECRLRFVVTEVEALP